MDFTREPIVETIISPRDGFRLVIRSSKNPGQEEFAVDSVEVVSFGSICFYRHLERPRSFMVPASDYEVLEVREARLSLKAASFEGVVKTNASKESSRTQSKESKAPVLKEVSPSEPEEASVEKVSEEGSEELSTVSGEGGRHDRRRERKRGNRRKRGAREESEEAKAQEKIATPLAAPEAIVDLTSSSTKEVAVSSSTILPPPTTLIRDDLDRLRKNEQYRGAFYLKEGEGASKEKEDEEEVPVIPPLLREEENVQKEEESDYKATPLPPEEEDVRSPFWTGSSTLPKEKT